jgi:hypothetical protein
MGEADPIARSVAPGRDAVVRWIAVLVVAVLWLVTAGAGFSALAMLLLYVAQPADDLLAHGLPLLALALAAGVGAVRLDHYRQRRGT